MTSNHTFIEYLRSRIDQPGLEGDFARDAACDDKFPKKTRKRWGNIERYLRSVGACEAAIKGGRIAWGNFQKTQGTCYEG
jgi:hypothetical protein